MWLGLLLAVFIVIYVSINLKNALVGGKVQVGDLVAKVIAPLIIFLGSSVLYLI